MSRHYLFGPVEAEFVAQYLGGPRERGECLTFQADGSADLRAGPEDSWESVCARLPADWRPDFIVLYLPYQTVPSWVWQAPVPVIACASDANLLLHGYRLLLRRCELVLADSPTCALLQQAGIAHTCPVNLFGLGQDFISHPWTEGERDIDILFVGNLHPCVQRQRLRWLGRLARLAERCRVAIHTGVFGADYRALLARARITFNLSIRGECNQRALEGAIAGSLLFQERGNAEIGRYFRDRADCVLYGEDDLELLLTHYLEHEEERRALAERGQQRACAYSFARFWAEALERIAEEWAVLVERRDQRPAFRPEEELLQRTWQVLGASDFRDERLSADLTAALAHEPQNAALHNALGLVVTRAAQGRGSISSSHAQSAAAHFRRAVAAEPNHLLAQLNLAEALVGTGQKEEAIWQARAALTALERLPERWPEDASLPGWLEQGHFPPGFDLFRVEWERAAWTLAGMPAAEARAKRDLVRWRLHALLASLTGSLSHHYEAVHARPELPLTQAGLGSALLRSGEPVPAVAQLRAAVAGDPFHRGAARALFDALGAAGDSDGQRRLARDQRRLLQAAPGIVKPEAWFQEAPLVGDELASLVILCCNELDYTRQCLESVLRHTRRPYELVLIDNASTDGTAAYLEAIKARPGPQRVMVIHNDTNRGFPAGCNQGIAAARGDYVVFLNNDTLVTEGWLDGLIAWSLHDWPKVGLVGAVTNFSRPPQQIAVDYTGLDDLPAFAARRRSAYARQATEVERLTGFCLLARRAVLQQIGGFDERYGAGFFDDDDLCVRARQAGLRLLLALNVFIHHFGSQTFQGLQVDCRKQLEENFAQFKEKWGPEHSAGYRFPHVAAAQTNGVAESPTGRPRVSLTMIVKDEEANLPLCLQSVADLFDEIIIVDTGSTDRTREIAAGFGARVIDFPWCDSFSAARNEGLRHATGQWIFWMDADDRLDEPNRQKLRTLLAGLKPENVAYAMKCHCLPNPQTGQQTVVDHVRLVRNHPQLRWEHRVHEQILAAVRRQGGTIRTADVVIQHTGYQDPALRRRKLERDLRLLLLEQAEQPDHPFTLFNLGSVYQELGRHPEALPLLRRSLEGSHPRDSIVRKLYAMLVQSHRLLDQRVEALAVCQEGRALYPDDAELLYREAQLREERGDLQGAEACLLRLVETEEAPHFASIAAGLRGCLGRNLLAMIYRRQGRLAEAEAQWRLCLEEQPSFDSAWLGLGELFLGQQRWQELEQVTGQLEGKGGKSLDAALLRARGHLGRKEFGVARAILEGILAQRPRVTPAWRFLSHVLLQEGRDWAGAEKALRTVLELDPGDTEAQSNLAVLLRQQGRAAS